MIVADTDILIDFLQGRESAAGRIARELEHGLLATTAVTRFELLAGSRSAKQARLILELLAAMPCLPLDSTAADRAADVRRHLERRGTGIGMGDSLIAGIVLVANAVLLTRNRRHFDRVSGLVLEYLGS